MEQELSNRVNNLSPSATFAMLAKTVELKAQGVDIISMSVGEPDFPTPCHIKEAAKKAIDENYSTYSPVPGYAALKKAVCAKLLKENGLAFEEDRIVISNGAKQSICNAVMALVNPGDEVIVPAPYWVSYPQMVLLAEGVPVYVEAKIEQGFKITPSQLEAAITPRTRAIILCSPSNPTGAIYSREELRALKDVLVRHPRVIVISDEIYEHLNYKGGHESIAQFDDFRDRVVVVNGVSKAYAMTGWRIGYIAAPTWIAKACAKLQGQYTSGACSVSQMAALAAYEGPQECVETMRKEFAARKDLIVDLLRGIPGLEVLSPDGAFYVLPKCSSYFGSCHDGEVIRSSSDLAMYLLEEGHVATVGGDAFGAPECIRLSYATSRDCIVEGCRRIKEALAKLQRV